MDPKPDTTRVPVAFYHCEDFDFGAVPKCFELLPDVIIESKIVNDELVVKYVEQSRKSIGRGIVLAKGEILNQVSSHHVYSSSS